ncbi:fumarylacetoacetate hydrolase family protein [Euzebya pacifica]|uniref:fumarylacetoacetate hydrolase family protein n=1 Tax=Euzebya pacifica TaxID=1608957 RepID=UPI0030F60C17
MRLVTYEIDTPIGPARRVGALRQDGQVVVDLRVAYATARSDGKGVTMATDEAEWLVPADMVGFLENGEEAMEAARVGLELAERTEEPIGVGGRRMQATASDVRIVSPLPRPPTIRDFSCMEEHYRNAIRRLGLWDEVPQSWYDWPPYYKGNPLTVIGPEDDVEWPVYATEVDYELEVAMVIGRRGKNVTLDDAFAHIAGFTIFNDISIRNIQSGEQSTGVGLSKSKDFDTGNILGPCIVTPDEFDCRAANATVRINGEVRNEGSLDAMYHSWEDLIVHASQSETIHPGEVFASGTLGRGSGMELGRYLEPDDLMELEVEGIGLLRNRLVKRTS